MNIHREYRGASGGYHIMMDGEQVHFTKNEYEADMFMAELKARVANSDEIKRLVSLNERYKQALQEFTDKHFHGGSKANRNDYVALGVPTADIYKLRQALEE